MRSDDKSPRRHPVHRTALLLILLGVAPLDGTAAEAVGVKVELAEPAGSATVSVVALAKHKVRLDVDPNGQRKPLTLRIELPASGRHFWPAEDVQVFDATQQPVAARHNGTEWHKFTIRVPPQRTTYMVRVVARPGGPQRVFPEKERHATDTVTGLSATIAKWHDGRRAALCIRFDDAHPTHLSKAIPALREYGFRATFMINPGTRDERYSSRQRSPYQEHLAEWEAVARRGDQEFANHTSRHRGAANDQDMEHEIGDAAQVIWELFPNRSKLLALNFGGGTWWETKKSLRVYLDQWPSFLVTGSLGMDDTYGNRVATFRRHVERNLQPGLGWCKAHFHSIGKGLGTSETNFRAVLDVAKEHESELWITGLADAYKYLTERRGARLALNDSGPSRVRFTILCSTNVALYDQPLTIDVTLPKSWGKDRVTVIDSNKQPIETSLLRSSDNRLLRFHVQPIDAEYEIEHHSPN